MLTVSRRHARCAWLTTLASACALAVLAAHARSLPPVDALGTSPTPSPAAKALRAPVGAISAHFEERLGVPTLLWLERPVPGAKAATSASPADIARAALEQRASLYGMSAAEVDAAPLHHVDALRNGAALVRFTNQRDGIEVFRESATVLVGAARQVVAIGGYLGPTAAPPVQQKAARSAFALSPQDAIARALGDYGFDTSVAFELTSPMPPAAQASALAPASYRTFALARGRASADGSRMALPARAKPVWFRVPGGLVGGYYVEIEMIDGATREIDNYAYVIAGDDGRLLYRHNQTADAAFTYRTYAETTGIHLPLIGPQGRGGTPHPTGLNDGFQPPFAAQNDITLQNGPISTNDPWLDPAATRTIGNNVEAWANHTGPAASPTNDPQDGTFDPDPNECNLAAPQAADFHACLSAPGSFAYTFDPTAAPESTKTQVMAAVVNLFYMNNWLHDWYYDAGFREVDGNAQTDNFGRGGLGDDSIRAQGQDYEGTDNANMATPSDGARPRMRMYIFTGTGSAAVSVQALGNFAVGTADFGPQEFDVTANLALASPSDGCTTITSNVAGLLAVIDRGNCSFKTKALNAQNAGAVGVVVANNAAGLVGMGDDPTITTAITIPSLLVSQADGASIKTALGGGPVSGRLRRVVGVDRDGTVDNSIISHEWGHYISNRLIADANGLTTNQSEGLGEGWADFHALLMMVHAEDALVPADANFNGTYAVAGYVSDGPQIPDVSLSTAYYSGLRRYPYSSDLTKNPLTFQDIQTGVPLPASPPPAFTGDNAEVHNTGEVWASMLWGCYSNLLRDTGRLTFAEAQDRMKRYLVAAYKLTPENPVLTEARDALFAAMAAGDPADLAQCMDAFAQRGAGLGAQFTGDRFGGTNAGVVESNATGNDLEIASITYDGASGQYCDADPFLDNGETGRLTVTVKNIGAGTLSATTVALSGAAGLTFPSGASLPLPAIAPFASASVTFDVALSGAAPVSTASISATASDPSVALGLAVGSITLPVQRDRAATVSASDDVEDPNSPWTPSLEQTTDASLAWRRVEVSTFDHHWTAPTGPSRGIAWLTSPALQVAASGSFSMTFSYRHVFESFGGNNFDGGVIEVSQDNGATWTDVETVIGSTSVYNGAITTLSDNPLGGRRAFVAESASYPSMLQRTITFPAALLGKTVRVRFGAATDSDGNLLGIDLDDVSFTALTNAPFPGYVADAHACAIATATAGTPQSTGTGTAFATTLQARVTRLGVPVVGAAVRFTAPASGASGTFPGAAAFADTVTDSNGFATAPALTANANAGAYVVTANAGLASTAFQLTNVGTVTDPPRLANISTRMDVLTGNNVMIAGFIIGGSTPKTVAITATGPSLVPFGITNPLANPTLTLVRQSDHAVIATNDDWQTDVNAAQLTSSGFAPTDPHESGLVVTLPPGAYTAIVSGAGNGIGVSVIGVFEIDHPEIPLINISTRGLVQGGNNVMIAGLIVQGSGPQKVVITATGPSLAPFGITNPLANPTLTLVRQSDHAVIGTNDDWQTNANAADITASGFAPTDPHESALLVTLDPGAYTAIVSGVGGGTGVSVVGVFTTP